MLARARPPTGMAFVIVQHLDPNHESMLAQLLDRQTELEVLQCEGGERIAGDKVYIIPPGRGLVIQNGVLELTHFVQPRGLRRPIDDFFLSLAVDQQANAACVILSGTGADGTTGLRAIKEHGGVCVVQQPDTARYDGMPLSAVGTSLVDFVRPPGEIVDCLTSFFRRRGTDGVDDEARLVADHIDDLCRVIRAAVGHDFSGYKRTTLVRRVERRMHVLGLESGRAYLGRVRADKTECEALFRDLLINVTRFFRDAEMFELLRERVVEPCCAPAIPRRTSGSGSRAAPAARRPTASPCCSPTPRAASACRWRSRSSPPTSTSACSRSPGRRLTRPPRSPTSRPICGSATSSSTPSASPSRPRSAT